MYVLKESAGGSAKSTLPLTLFFWKGIYFKSNTLTYSVFDL